MTNGSTELLRLPFAGRWFVGQAGDTPNVNHHMKVRAQWFGVDFLKVGGDSGRALVRTNGTAVEDFYSWDEPVLAPAEGEVVGAVDGLSDCVLGQKDPANLAGNHVVIRTAQERFIFIAHLKKGSLAVAVGERVQTGQVLGRCGNSGNSSAPHIHLHVQDTPVLNQGKGQRTVFQGINVELSGKRFDNVDWPLISGLFVWPA